MADGINKDNPDQKFLKNNHDLSQLDYYEKRITGDGNCYYRCLSYYYRGTEDYHLEFRQLISELFDNNLDKFISCYPYPDILGEKEPETNEEILNFLKNILIILNNLMYRLGIRNNFNILFFWNKYKCLNNKLYGVYFNFSENYWGGPPHPPLWNGTEED